MPSDEAPSDDAVRTSYNFAPGYYGLIYRADVPDYGAGPRRDVKEEDQAGDAEERPAEDSQDTHYKLQAMKWGALLRRSLL
jgi:hypothetical protein